MPPIVEFFFSPGSRYSYLAASQIPQLEADTHCRVVWRAVHGPEIRALRGRDPFAGDPVSGQYDWKYRRDDAECWADYYGIPFREPPSHVFDSAVMVRAVIAAERLGMGVPYAQRLAQVFYGEGAWPVDAGLCTRVAQDAGLHAGNFVPLLDDEETARQARAAAADAHRRGAFGVPTFFVDDRMFWGNDRIVLLRHHLLTA